MAIRNIGSGSVITDKIREALTDQSLPTAPHFAIRASHEGPLALTTLSVDFSLIVPPVKKFSKGWVMVPITKPLLVGTRLGWTVLAGFKVSRLGAYLIKNGTVRYLKATKKPTPAGSYWADSIKLQTKHLK